MSQISKIQALLNKPSVELRFVDETNYSGLNVPFLFDGPSHNPINNLSESLLKELDKITIIANKEILGKSDWSGFGNASGALPTTTTTTTAAPTTTTTTSVQPGMTITLGNLVSTGYPMGKGKGGTKTIRQIDALFSLSVQAWIAESGMDASTIQVVGLRTINPNISGNESNISQYNSMYPKTINSINYWGLQTVKFGTAALVSSFMQGSLQGTYGGGSLLGALDINDLQTAPTVGPSFLPYGAGNLNLSNPSEQIVFAAFIRDQFMNRVYIPNTLTGTYTLSQIA